MTIHTANLNLKALKAVSLAAPKNDVRYYLNGVFVERRAGTLYLVATDGHRLHAAREKSDGEDFAIIVGIEHVAAILKDAPRFLKTMDLEYNNETGNFQCGSTIGKPIDGIFPNWRHIIPRGGPVNEVRHFNPDYLRDVRAAACVYLDKSPKSDYFAQLTHHADNQASAYAADDFMALVMPLRTCASPADLSTWRTEQLSSEVHR